MSDNAVGDDSGRIEELERELAEARDLAKRFDAFMEHCPTTAFIKDADGRLIYINRAFEEAFAFEGRDWRNKTDFELWPEETARILRANDERILASGRAEAVEETVRGPKGDRHWWTIKFPFRDHDERAFLAGMGTDLTERKQLEEAVARATRLDSIGVLAGGIAHDFNNLIGVILAYGELALLSPDDADLKDNITAIMEAAQRAAWLTRQLLGVARQQPVVRQHVDVNALVSEQAAVARRVFPEDIEIRCILEPKLPGVLFDPNQLRQVLMNLLINSKEAIAASGEVVVSTARHPADAEGPERISIVVRDSGAGVDPEALPRVFEPFWTTKEPGEGTGLGLATSYGIVKQHGGVIRLDSSPGEGCAVTIALPADSAGSPVPDRRSDSVPGGEERIVLVEDNEPLRMGLTRILSRHGYVVVEAADGVEALDLLKPKLPSIDLVITDVIMPRLNGAQLAEALWRLDPELPILFLSGYSGNELASRGIQESEIDLLAKPIEAVDLLLRVRAILDRRQAASDASGEGDPGSAS